MFDPRDKRKYSRKLLGKNLVRIFIYELMYPNSKSTGRKKGRGSGSIANFTGWRVRKKEF